MRLFFDTNVIVAAVTRDTDRSEAAVTVLNECEEGYASLLNLMELRTVLAKKKQIERDRVRQIEQRVASRVTVTFPDASDFLDANRVQEEKLLYPMDAIVLSAADAVDAELVTFDSELQEHGAISPSEAIAVDID
ncbi:MULTISPECIES: type II toxin-antitoxin system VapC family toxin [Halorubrum]|uniref:Ribonuclease VapC n=1 Tax=Halorubrum hochstenium ATCC 700873 TaxID=1227481 RepID=M0FMV0_9EURY|nr:MULTISPECIES: PIN domain-containing protein [Halorubrum]ELZ60597.1 PilT protein domain-containing protein [Halorubrum hochstenium ATCC 700873]